MYALINGKIISGHSILKGYAIIIEQNLLAKIIPIEDVPSTIEKIDVSDAYISPGFIDLQINGCGGVLFNDDISINTINTMLKTNLKYGCTSFLPTLITSTKDDIQKALKITYEAYNSMPNNVLGIHLEGPFIHKEKKGIHNEEFIRPITSEETDILRNEASNFPIILTLAPEVNDLGLIESLVQSGVKVSLGHSQANYNEAMAAIELGVVNSTHLFNAMAPLSHRDPGIVAAILNSPNVYAGMIMDGFHVDFNLIRLIKSIKQENLYIVTDAVPPSGCKEKTEFQFGGQEVTVVDGKVINKHGTLGGSIITMIDSVYNVSEVMGLGVVEAVRMATIYPARVIGCHNRLGLIKKGYIANLAIFDGNFKMKYTINNGELIKIN